MTNKTSKQKNLYKQRLEARKEQLRREAQENQMRLQNNARYTVKNGAAMIGASVSESIAQKNPKLARLVGKLGFGGGSGATQPNTPIDPPHGYPDRANRPEVGQKSLAGRINWIKLVENLALPLLLTMGRRQMLAMGLKGGGKLAGSILGTLTRGLFGRKKKKRRK